MTSLSKQPTTAVTAGYTPEEFAEYLQPHERALLTNDSAHLSAEAREGARDYFKLTGITDEFGLYTAFGKAVRSAAIAKARGQ